MKTGSFKDLIVWQKSYKLACEIYKTAGRFPKNEMYGLTSQIKRSAVSIPSNIAEGYGRQFSREYKQFLSIAYGSLCELETQYLLSIDLKLVDGSENIELLMKEVGSKLYRMLNPVEKNQQA